MDRVFMYAAFLAPVIIICGLALTVTVARNAKARKAGEKRGLFE